MAATRELGSNEMSGATEEVHCSAGIEVACNCLCELYGLTGDVEVQRAALQLAAAFPNAEAAEAEADAEASRAAADMVVRAAELRQQLASRAVAAEDEARAADQAASVVVAAMRHGEQEMIETLGSPARRLQTAIDERRRRWFRLGRQ